MSPKCPNCHRDLPQRIFGSIPYCCSQGTTGQNKSCTTNSKRRSFRHSQHIHVEFQDEASYKMRWGYFVGIRGGRAACVTRLPRIMCSKRRPSRKTVYIGPGTRTPRRLILRFNLPPKTCTTTDVVQPLSAPRTSDSSPKAVKSSYPLPRGRPKKGNGQCLLNASLRIGCVILECLEYRTICL